MAHSAYLHPGTVFNYPEARRYTPRVSKFSKIVFLVGV